MYSLVLEFISCFEAQGMLVDRKQTPSSRAILGEALSEAIAEPMLKPSQGGGIGLLVGVEFVLIVL